MRSSPLLLATVILGCSGPNTPMAKVVKPSEPSPVPGVQIFGPQKGLVNTPLPRSLTGARPKSRKEFAERSDQLLFRAATKEQVLKALGKPDDVIRDYELLTTSSNVSEIWSYGASRHQGFPSLGFVRFDLYGKAFDALLARQEHEDFASLPDENTLRPLLELLDGGDWMRRSARVSDSPLELIQLTNALQPLGKKAAVAVLKEYCRVAQLSNTDLKVPRLLRCLFVPPKGFQPRALPLAEDDDVWPATLGSTARYPFLLNEDVPIEVAPYNSWGGHGMSLEPYIDDFAGPCSLLARPLRPPDDPLSLIRDQKAPEHANAALKDWLAKYKEAARYAVYSLLTESVYSPPDSLAYEDRWKDLLHFLDGYPVHWDASQQTYVVADGSHPVRLSMRPGIKGAELRIPGFEKIGLKVIGARDRGQMDWPLPLPTFDKICLRWKPGARRPRGVVRVLGPDSHPLFSISLPSGNVRSGTGWVDGKDPTSMEGTIDEPKTNVYRIEARLNGGKPITETLVIPLLDDETKS